MFLGPAFGLRSRGRMHMSWWKNLVDGAGKVFKSVAKGVGDAFKKIFTKENFKQNFPGISNLFDKLKKAFNSGKLSDYRSVFNDPSLRGLMQQMRDYRDYHRTEAGYHLYQQYMEQLRNTTRPGRPDDYAWANNQWMNQTYPGGYIPNPNYQPQPNYPAYPPSFPPNYTGQYPGGAQVVNVYNGAVTINNMIAQAQQQPNAGSVLQQWFPSAYAQNGGFNPNMGI